jgi:hypothetical protein
VVRQLPNAWETRKDFHIMFAVAQIARNPEGQNLNARGRVRQKLTGGKKGIHVAASFGTIIRPSKKEESLLWAFMELLQ